MSRTEAEVVDECMALLPGGWAWPRSAQSGVGQFMQALGSSLSAFEAAAESQVLEVDPRTAQQMLADYERVLGPDPCGRDLLALAPSDAARLAYQRWTAGGGQSIAFFVALAASLGVAITITETVLSQAGAFWCGATTLASPPEQYSWRVNLPTAVVDYFVAGGSHAGECLGSFAPNLVACVIRLFAPAHTTVVFNYS
jgi:uncharacterized protein YmfQ (DUF2313 family)